MLRSCKRFYQEKLIKVDENLSIQTVIFNPGVPNRPPLILLHGLHTGLCFWLENIKKLSRSGTVYAIDLPGFGRSSKPDISTNSGKEVERKYVQWLEVWRQKIGIEMFVLLGHNFGGYIATLYALAYPWRVSHLILYEPWGFPILPFGLTDRSPSKKNQELQPEIFPKWIAIMDKIFHIMQRLSFLYNILCISCLPLKYTKNILLYLRGFYRKQSPYAEYQNLCRQSGNSCGKIAFDKLSVLNMWAKDPLARRINDLDNRVHVLFIFGSKSWFDHRSAYEVKCSRSDNTVNVYIIEGEGSKLIHLEKPKDFELIILSTLKPYYEVNDEGWIEDDWICFDKSDDLSEI